MTKPDHHLSAGSAELKNRIATITIDDEGHRNSELQQVLVAGYVALKWALPLQAAVETIDAIAALMPAAPQTVGDRYVHIDNVVYHLDDVEVDADGKCAWTDVANALTHIKLCIEIRTASCPLPRPQSGSGQ